MAEPARRPWTLDEFLAFDDGTDTRYELFEGQIVAMAPASGVHGALDHASRPADRERPATGPVRDRRSRYRPPGARREPLRSRLAITWTGLTGQQFVAEPVLIVEVFSPSTATTDRDRKLPDYRTIPSLQDILVVSSTEPRIEHFRRETDGWKAHDLRGQGTLLLEALDLTIELAELYAGVLPPAEAPAACPARA